MIYLFRNEWGIWHVRGPGNVALCGITRVRVGAVVGAHATMPPANVGGIVVCPNCRYAQSEQAQA